MDYRYRFNNTNPLTISDLIEMLQNFQKAFEPTMGSGDDLLVQDARGHQILGNQVRPVYNADEQEITGIQIGKGVVPPNSPTVINGHQLYDDSTQTPDEWKVWAGPMETVNEQLDEFDRLEAASLLKKEEFQAWLKK